MVATRSMTRRLQQQELQLADVPRQAPRAIQAPGPRRSLRVQQAARAQQAQPAQQPAQRGPSPRRAPRRQRVPRVRQRAPRVPRAARVPTPPPPPPPPPRRLPPVPKVPCGRATRSSLNLEDSTRFRLYMLQLPDVTQRRIRSEDGGLYFRKQEPLAYSEKRAAFEKHLIAEKPQAPPDRRHQRRCNRVLYRTLGIRPRRKRPAPEPFIPEDESGESPSSPSGDSNNKRRRVQEQTTLSEPGPSGYVPPAATVPPQLAAPRRAKRKASASPARPVNHRGGKRQNTEVAAAELSSPGSSSPEPVTPVAPTRLASPRRAEREPTPSRIANRCLETEMAAAELSPPSSPVASPTPSDQVSDPCAGLPEFENLEYPEWYEDLVLEVDDYGNIKRPPDCPRPQPEPLERFYDPDHGGYLYLHVFPGPRTPEPVSLTSSDDTGSSEEEDTDPDEREDLEHGEALRLQRERNELLLQLYEQHMEESAKDGRYFKLDEGGMLNEPPTFEEFAEQQPDDLAGSTAQMGSAARVRPFQRR